MRTNHGMHIMDHNGVKIFLKQQSHFHVCFDDSYSKNYSIIQEMCRENTNLEKILSRCAYPNCAVCM